MLSIRNTLKEDIGCTTAELVFGTTLALPGQFCELYTHSKLTTQYTHDLKQHMKNLVFTPTRSQTRDVFIPTDLHTCDYVFVRNDTVKKLLCPTYTGLHKVLQKQSKYFIVETNAKSNTISIDSIF